MLEASRGELASLRRVIARKVKIEEQYSALLSDFRREKGRVCEAEVAAGQARAEMARSLREAGNVSNVESRLVGTWRALRDRGEATIGRASAVARVVERLFDKYVAAAAQVHAETRTSCDMWLADAQYRVAAAVLETAWRAFSEELGNLFRVAKAAEIEARRTLFAATTALADACHAAGAQRVDLGEEPDYEAVANSDLGARATDLAARRRLQAPRGQAEDQAADPPVDDVTLGPPVYSPLVVAARVLDRRRDGPVVISPGKRWRACLVVVTADKFLHAFDLPPDDAAAAEKKKTIDDAFDDVVATGTDDFLGAADARSPKDPLKPAVSVDLTNSCLLLPTTEGPLDIVETIVNVGAKKLLGKTQTRKTTLRPRGGTSPNPDPDPASFDDLCRLLQKAVVVVEGPMMLRVVAVASAIAVVPGLALAPARLRATPRRQHQQRTRNLAAAVSAVRLDAPLLRRSAPLDAIFPPMGAVVAALAALAGAVTAAVIFSMVSSLFRDEGEVRGAERRSAVVATPQPAPVEEYEGGGGGRDSFGRIKHFARLQWGTVRAAFETLRLWWSSRFDDEPLATLPEMWAPCLLQDRREAGDGYVAYRFALKAGPGFVLPLSLGQELTVMCLDDKNRPVRASFPLASSRRDPTGTVEIVLPAANRLLRRMQLGALTAEQLTVANALDGLAVGGEAAVRAGRKAFDYKGPHLPITSLQCFVEELGAIPTLQVLQESLVKGQSTVESADVFCINSTEDDFALYDKLEETYYKFHRKMTLACVLDDNLYDGILDADAPPPDKSQSDDKSTPSSSSSSSSSSTKRRQKTPTTIFQRNDDLRMAVRPWQPGMLAVVAGPPSFETLVSRHLTSVLGYPQDCVLAL
ncbi:hypothetical protein CTAYLR_003339 [Chrysophaeum taylorii]|uniref:Uncharacterized protein n=1 Tax=Chrysophaeum taylorii TaxID=2483200 RepID=A0AAD7UG39_9STRA|nr:hypothetical protein CTAYLR_003339 [Chrysophaeum taylorii]